MENVPGILWPRHAAALRRLYKEAELAGYDVMEPEILDARDYGLPQRRKRVFILGLRKDQAPIMDWVPEPTHCNPTAVHENRGLKAWISCAEVFRLPLAKADPNNVHMQHSAELVKVFKKTPANGGSRKDSGRLLPCHSDYDGHNDVYGRIDPKKSAPTITTACINPSKGRFVHPTEHHGITLRHAARLQTFPDEYVFDGGLMASGVQIGNAVPIRLGKVLLARIVKLLTCRKVRIAHAGRAPAVLAAE
jgi:DNA (cytosine-5)-methyltransferase 1